MNLETTRRKAYSKYCSTTTTTTIYSHYIKQPAQEQLEDFVQAKFCCPHALTDSIRQKMLDFSSMVLLALLLYRLYS